MKIVSGKVRLANMCALMKIIVSTDLFLVLSQIVDVTSKIKRKKELEKHLKDDDSKHVWMYARNTAKQLIDV